MAFKNCFYLQFLEDPNPGIDFAASDFNWQRDERKADMYFGYEKPDGSEPNWIKLGVNDGETLHIDVRLGQKIYFKGTRTLTYCYWRSTGIQRPGGTPKWFNWTTKSETSKVCVGGCPLSMQNDGDGSVDGQCLTIGADYFDFSYLLAYFPGVIDVSNMTLPTKGDGILAIFNFMFAEDKIEGLYRNFMPKFSLGLYSLYAMFYKATLDTIYLPYTDEDLTQQGCMAEMFNSATVKEIHVEFKNWYNNRQTSGWVNGISSQGKFYSPSELPIIYDINHFPAGWEVNPPYLAVSATFAATHKLGGRKF